MSVELFAFAVDVEQTKTQQTLPGSPSHVYGCWESLVMGPICDGGLSRFERDLSSRLVSYPRILLPIFSLKELVH